MKKDRYKKVMICLAIADIILTASIGYTVFNLPEQEKDKEILYIIEYTKEVEEYNYTDNWTGEGNITIIHPIPFDNISKIDFFLEWSSMHIYFTTPVGGTSTFNMTIIEPPNSTATYHPNNSVEKTVHGNGGTYDWMRISCDVNDHFKGFWIYASSMEEALENTTEINGWGNWSIEIKGEASETYLTSSDIFWRLNIKVHYYEGTLVMGE